MKYSLAVVALWGLAIITTLILVPDKGVFTYLGPVYAVCMIGSVVVVQRAARSPRPAV